VTNTLTTRTATEQLVVRIHNPQAETTLIYLPGLHGDWTIVGNFRRAIGNRVRFVETTYPRTLTWSLDDYAKAVEDALLREGLSHGWLLAESFSSLVLWPLLARKELQAQGIILVGGFVRHPMQWGARLAEFICGALPLPVFHGILFGYGKLARFRFRHSPETCGDINEFIDRRTDLDRRAMKHRLHLVSQADFCSTAKQFTIPIYGLTGLFDPIVPWLPVRRWLKRNCATLRDFTVIRACDHNVLGNAPEKAARQVLQWIGVAADVSRRR